MLQHKEKMRKESGPGSISNLDKLYPGMARSVRTQPARRRESPRPLAEPQAWSGLFVL